ncbi:hypothetical protein B0J14DRAFT_297459 [Halenospora varia]|nr:hypothetical protein B0J14DRAFT_297459 [Halenospora varia]
MRLHAGQRPLKSHLYGYSSLAVGLEVAICVGGALRATSWAQLTNHDDFWEFSSICGLHGILDMFCIHIWVYSTNYFVFISCSLKIYQPFIPVLPLHLPPLRDNEADSCLFTDSEIVVMTSKAEVYDDADIYGII